MTTDSNLVLVIEDDTTIVELLRAVLTDEGYDVRVAASGDQALDNPSPIAPAVTVLDMHVPGASGKQLADGLRAKYGADLPILLVSASNMDEEALTLGAYEYVSKPFDLEDLLAAIRRGMAHAS